jgi:hypothetical membrane protein
MTKVLIGQVRFVPALALALILLAGVLTPGYSSLSQHISELGILPGWPGFAMRSGAIFAGTSVALFGLGLIVHRPYRMVFTGLAAFVFGASYASGGVFPMGDARHGLWGLVMFYLLIPGFFAAEAPEALRSRLVVNVSLFAALLTLLYMWFLLSGLEPQEIRGLTARIAVLVIFGWHGFAGYVLNVQQSGQAGQNP